MHRGWTPAADRADPIALLEEQATTRVQELVPIRYGRMAVIAVHVLSGRGAADGGRPVGDAGERPDGPGLWRRSPVELRSVRLARAEPAVRHQRLRRDTAGAVGVGSQAARGQPDGGRARARVRPGDERPHGPCGRPQLPRADGRLRRDVRARGVLRTSRCRGDHRVRQQARAAVPRIDRPVVDPSTTASTNFPS